MKCCCFQRGRINLFGHWPLFSFNHQQTHTFPISCLQLQRIHTCRQTRQQDLPGARRRLSFFHCLTVHIEQLQANRRRSRSRQDQSGFFADVGEDANGKNFIIEQVRMEEIRVERCYNSTRPSCAPYSFVNFPPVCLRCTGDSYLPNQHCPRHADKP